MRRIIIASQSPRRRELMEQAGYEFTVVPSDVEEKIKSTKPWEVVVELSAQKAEDVYNKAMENEEQHIVVIGADTVVAIDGEILGKPENEAVAKEMLKRLQGRMHQVYTGVTLMWNEGREDKKCSFCECTEVTFCCMTDEEIDNYVATGDSLDKAGAYGIQGSGAIYIERISGDYNNVVGLPISRVYQEMKKIV